MDFAYSPHREGGGTMHLPSPTHHHGYGLESLSSIQQLRRSLSRSPSKPSRFNLRKSDSSRSPLSPLALARAFSPKPHHKDQSPTAHHPESPLAAQIPPPSAKKRFTLRRSAPFRSSPRNRPASKSPRRALAESTDHGNATPLTAMRSSGEENNVFRRTSAEYLDKMKTEQKSTMRFDVDDKPIKFDLGRSRQDLNADVPAKSSPLKRSDGIMNLDTAGVGSPVAKRRSLHGASAFGSDFDIFDHAPTPRSSGEEPRRPHDSEMANSFSFSSPITKTQSPLRKTSSLRKTTLSQRYGSNAPKPKLAYDGEFALPVQAASKTRHRMSLDGSLAFSSGTTQSPFRRSATFDAMRGPVHQPCLRGGAGSHQPHPLSNALTPSSSLSSMADDSPTHAPIPPTAAPPQNHPFARSLPIGASRPQPPPETFDGSFETPMAFKMAKPNPDAFMSTGLLSKKNRNVNEPRDMAYIMPGTPSKRNSFPPVTASPSINRRNNLLDLGNMSRPEFGQPSTPFSVHRPSSSLFYGKGTNIFGSFDSTHQRRSSFASIDGDDNPNSNSNSPCGNRMTDSQSSADDMPPTPTKQGDGAGRRSKESSLRRKTFGRQRATLDTDTFSAPANQETPSIDIPAPSSARKLLFDSSSSSSPHTPNESFVPPDPSKLSISGQRRGSLPFNSSTSSNPFPPATPTTPRDHSNFFAHSQAGIAPIAGLTQNDVDSALSRRFHTVTLFGNGEFSMVYRVENPVNKRLGFASPPASRVWAVKKTKKPYAGQFDREKKMTEVHVLQALRGHDHILSLEDHWEHNGHLYIQTEFCEEGNLKDFLAVAGNKSRLDDFRIWKILLELSLGVKYIHDNGYIHLDLKPANILITFDGVLKIADFGLASPWPAGRYIDGEGDRHYLAPEALQGRYDKPCDVYALGAIMCEIAANIFLPENGTSWQRLRTGDFSELPSLTWSSESSLNRDVNGEPLSDSEDANGSTETICISDSGEDSLKHITVPAITGHTGGLTTPPRFMIDENDPDSLHQIAQWMMHPDPDQRPTINQVYLCYGCQWVEKRSRAGATVFEGNWGPADDVLHHAQVADMMDTS